MPRSHCSSNDEVNSSQDEEEKHSKINKKGKKKASKRSRDLPLTSPASSSSDETEVRKRKSRKAKAKTDGTNDTMQNTAPIKEKEKRPSKTLLKNENPSFGFKDDDYSPATDSNKVKDSDKNNDGHISSQSSLDPKETSSSSKSSGNSDTRKEEPKDETDKPTDAAPKVVPPQPIQPPVSISVVEKSSQPEFRRRSGSARLKPTNQVLKPRAKYYARKRIPIQPPEPPIVEPPAETSNTTTTTTTAPDTQAETEEASKTSPEKEPVHVCMRDCWGARKTKYKDADDEECRLTLPSRRVVFLCDTEVDPCDSEDLCEYRMRRIQEHHMDKLGLKDIAYNWIVGGDLRIYEGLGWNYRSPAVRDSPLQQKTGHDIYVGFIGKYDPTNLPIEMLNYALAFLYLSMNDKRLLEDYDTMVDDKLIVINDDQYDILPYM